MAKSRNSRLFALGSCEKVDVNTGESVPVEGGGFKMLPGPPGSCEWCHVVHDPTQPHNQQSLAYRMKFNAIHGRSPTWTDALAHCSEETKRVWREQLVKMMEQHGMEIPEDLRNGREDAE
jgi:hypothetical protein